MALLNIFRGTQAEVSERPVSDGALLFATDTKKIYLDKDLSRIEMSSVQDLSDYVTTSELEGFLATKADATHTHADVTNDASGFMSTADKTKLDGLVGVPAGGTDGQVLTSDGAGGAAWENVPQPDLTGVVKAEDTSFLGTKKLTVNGEDIRLLSVRTTSSDHTQGSEFYVGSKDGYVRIASSPYDNDASVESQSSVGITGKDGTNYLSLSVAGNKARFSLNKKTVQNIVDLIQESPVGNNLVTDKAVADYVAANAGGGGGLELLWQGRAETVTVRLNGDIEAYVMFTVLVDEQYWEKSYSFNYDSLMDIGEYDGNSVFQWTTSGDAIDFDCTTGFFIKQVVGFRMPDGSSSS